MWSLHAETASYTRTNDVLMPEVAPDSATRDGSVASTAEWWKHLRSVQPVVSSQCRLNRYQEYTFFQKSEVYTGQKRRHFNSLSLEKSTFPRRFPWEIICPYCKWTVKRPAVCFRFSLCITHTGMCFEYNSGWVSGSHTVWGAAGDYAHSPSYGAIIILFMWYF